MMISIVIPCYEMMGCGVTMLRELFSSICAQAFSDYEVIVSSDGVQPFGFPFPSARVTWHEGKPGAAANLNNAIDHVRGDIIKPMFQDDMFTEPDSLQKIADAFENGAWWVACNSQNGGEEGMRDDLFKPYPHIAIDRLREGENTYGSPSAMAWRQNKLRMDENLKWLFDCEFYGRMAEVYGVPAFIDTPIFIRQWSGMATHTIANGAQRVLDHNEVVEKYRDRGGKERPMTASNLV